jgi:hypothetical protein
MGLAYACNVLEPGRGLTDDGFPLCARLCLPERPRYSIDVMEDIMTLESLRGIDDRGFAHRRIVLVPVCRGCLRKAIA